MSTDTASRIAYEALDLSKKNARDIESHEDLCAERYAGIHDKIREIKGVITWAGGFAFVTVVGILGFLAQAQFNANDQQQKTQQTRIELLERQLIEARKPQ